jgi:hypothetical protein
MVDYQTFKNHNDTSNVSQVLRDCVLTYALKILKLDYNYYYVWNVKLSDRQTSLWSLDNTNQYI